MPRPCRSAILAASLAAVALAAHVRAELVSTPSASVADMNVVISTGVDGIACIEVSGQFQHPEAVPYAGTFRYPVSQPPEVTTIAPDFESARFRPEVIDLRVDGKTVIPLFVSMTVQSGIGSVSDLFVFSLQFDVARAGVDPGGIDTAAFDRKLADFVINVGAVPGRS